MAREEFLVLVKAKLIVFGPRRMLICLGWRFWIIKNQAQYSVSGGVRGALPWMAPESLNGRSSRVSEKEILTGEKPYADMHCGAIIVKFVFYGCKGDCEEDSSTSDSEAL